MVQSPTSKGHRLQPTWVTSGSHRARFDQLRAYFVNRTVLDVGCASGCSRPDWFHGLIADVASRTVGIDVDAEAVAELRERGLDIRLADAESLQLGEERFEVIHAGEVIEHLDQPGGFLRSALADLSPGGKVVLTTPNVFCISNFVYRVGGRRRVNADHVAWYCEDTMRQALERSGLEVEELFYLRHHTPGRGRAFVSRLVRMPFPDRLAWNTLAVVASASSSSST